MQYVGFCVFSLPNSLLMIVRIHVLHLIIIIKSEVRPTHLPLFIVLLGLGDETMVWAVCLFIFVCILPLNKLSLRYVHKSPTPQFLHYRHDYCQTAIMLYKGVMNIKSSDRSKSHCYTCVHLAAFVLPAQSQLCVGNSLSLLLGNKLNIQKYSYIKLSLKSVPGGLINNKTASVKVMAWCQVCNKALPEPILT